jgi:hypothetical protein
VIEKKTIPASEDYGQEFFFNIKQEGTLAEEFSLYSGDNYAYSPYSIPFWGGRDYTVEEVATPGWRIADIQCVNTDPRIFNAVWDWRPEGGAEVKMRRGKVITCKFINELTLDYGDAPDRERRWCKRGEGDNMQTREIEAEGQCASDEEEIPFVEYTELTADSVDADRHHRYKGPRYPTLLKNDGARHLIINEGFPKQAGIYLGDSTFNNTDSESNGQPTENADGDDYPNSNTVNATYTVDDEDGVQFITSLVPGRESTIQVYATGQGYLNAFIDFNADGDWNEYGEQIFDDSGIWLNNGINEITFDVPADAKFNVETYARFRYSTQGHLRPEGFARDGEVEDYKVYLEPGYCGDGTINQEWEECDGGAGCSERCLLEDDYTCRDLVLAKVDAEVLNYGAGNATDDVFLGKDYDPIPNGTWFATYYDGEFIVDEPMDGSDPYEDMEGLSVERQADGNLKLMLYGSHNMPGCKTVGQGAYGPIIMCDDAEFARGHIEFYNSKPEGQTSETDENKVEKPDDGISGWHKSDEYWYDPTNDEIWIDEIWNHDHQEEIKVSKFNLTVAGKNDSFTTQFNAPRCTGNISGYKWNDRDGDGEIDNDEDPIGGWKIAVKPEWMEVYDTCTVNAQNEYGCDVYMEDDHYYLVEVEGTWYDSGYLDHYGADNGVPAGHPFQADAEYVSYDSWDNYKNKDYQAETAPTYDLLVDHDNVDWGVYQGDIHGNYHLYKTLVYGYGSEINFRIDDDDFTNNSNDDLTVRVFDLGTEYWGDDYKGYITTTDKDNGFYSLDVYPGEYQVVEYIPHEWNQTRAMTGYVNPPWEVQAINALGNAGQIPDSPFKSYCHLDVTDYDAMCTFGNKMKPIDFGDAPEKERCGLRPNEVDADGQCANEVSDDGRGGYHGPDFPTTMKNDGARHIIKDSYMMGDYIDAEEDGQPSEDAKDDDNNYGINVQTITDDEDGVELLTDIVPGEMAQIKVTTTGEGYLNAWMDFNGNGEWDEWEQILDDKWVEGDTPDWWIFNPDSAEEDDDWYCRFQDNGQKIDCQFRIYIPCDAKDDTEIYSRFRFDSHGGLEPTGLAWDGEVEDYKWEVEPVISGYKWNDWDADGEWDKGEPGLSGWEIVVKPDDVSYDWPDYQYVILNPADAQYYGSPENYRVNVKPGRKYLIEAEGTWWDYDASYGHYSNEVCANDGKCYQSAVVHDAEYQSDNEWETYPGHPLKYYNHDDVPAGEYTYDVLVNGENINWGTYNEVYTREETGGHLYKYVIDGYCDHTNGL